MSIYLCCGANGILPLENVSFYYAQKCLNKYLVGARIVRKATSLLQACRIIEVWLTRAEKADEALQGRLHPMYARWKQQKYLVAVCCSGTQDLQEQTACLLLHNRNVFAAQAAEQERMQRNQQPSLFSTTDCKSQSVVVQ